jgi:hypothetical protein
MFEAVGGAANTEMAAVKIAARKAYFVFIKIPGVGLMDVV